MEAQPALCRPFFPSCAGSPPHPYMLRPLKAHPEIPVRGGMRLRSWARLFAPSPALPALLLDLLWGAAVGDSGPVFRFLIEQHRGKDDIRFPPFPRPNSCSGKPAFASLKARRESVRAVRHGDSKNAVFIRLCPNRVSPSR